MLSSWVTTSHLQYNTCSAMADYDRYLSQNQSNFSIWHAFHWRKIKELWLCKVMWTLFIYFHTSKVDRRIVYFHILHFLFQINVFDHFDCSKVYENLKKTCIKIHLHQHLTFSQAMPNLQSKPIYRCPIQICYQDQDKKCHLVSPNCPLNQVVFHLSWAPTYIEESLCV